MGTENFDRSAVGTIEVDAGSGWQKLGIIREEIIRINGKELTHLDVSGYPFGVDETIFGTVDIEIEFVWEEIGDIDLWNLVLHGGSITTTTAGIQMVSSEEVVITGTDWIALAHAADFTFDGVVTVNSGDGTTIYIENTDYYLDRKGGHLKRIAGGSITDRQIVCVDYSYDTYTGKYFIIFADLAPKNYIMRLTKPLMCGENMRITHSRAIFTVASMLPLRPGEDGAWAGASSKIRLLKDITGGTYGAYGRWEIYTP